MKMHIDDLTNLMREKVLEALDAAIREATGHGTAMGARDSDLPELFKSIDAHARRVAARFNARDSTEPGSAFFSVNMGNEG